MLQQDGRPAIVDFDRAEKIRFAPGKKRRSEPAFACERAELLEALRTFNREAAQLQKAIMLKRTKSAK